jgi:hypothetical protein
VQVSTLCLVELERVGDSVQDGLRGPAEVAALEPYVVLDAHACEQRDLFSAQALDPAVPSPGRESRILRGEAGTARAEELRGILPDIHDPNLATVLAP